MSKNQDLIDILKYSNLRDGEFIFKLNGKIITGHLNKFDFSLSHNSLTEFTAQGYIS